MDAKSCQDEKEKLVEKATSKIANIQYSEQLKRKQIGDIKQAITTSIAKNQEAEYLNNAAASAERLQLIRKMSEAAAAGNLEEMQHIKALLDIDH